MKIELQAGRPRRSFPDRAVVRRRPGPLADPHRGLGGRAGHGDAVPQRPACGFYDARRDVVTIWRDATRARARTGPSLVRRRSRHRPARRAGQGRCARRRRRHPSTAARSGGSSATRRARTGSHARFVYYVDPRHVRARRRAPEHPAPRRQDASAARRSRSPSTSGCPSTSACSSSRRRPTRSTSGVSCGGRPRPARSAARAAPARAPGRARSPRASRGPARPRATRSRP